MSTKARDHSDEQLERKVESRMAGDLALFVGRQRGFLDVDAVARKWVDEYGWRATPREVARIIRRYEVDDEFDVDEATDSLARASMRLGDEIAQIEIEPNSEHLKDILGLFELGPGEDWFSVETSKSAFVISGPDRIIDTVVEHLGVSKAQVTEGLGLIHFRFPEESQQMNVAIAVLMYILNHGGIEVVKVHEVDPHVSIVLPIGQRERAVSLIEYALEPVRDRAERDQ